MKTSLLIFFISLLTISATGQSCKNLPVTFKSYTEALSKIKASEFLIKDHVNCFGSSWIRQANFYSCDGERGYLILETKEGKEYLHRDVPLKIWKEFKNAKSFGSYYQDQIKGNYNFIIPS